MPDLEKGNVNLLKDRKKARQIKGELAAMAEEFTGRRLTSRMQTFCELFAEGIYTNAECAKRAGFPPEYAHQTANRILGGDAPQAAEYIKELREARERKYGVTTIGQLERLYMLSRGAEDSKQFSAAINAEKLRAALGGLTTDRRENLNRTVDMSRDQIMARLVELQQKYPFLRDITPTGEDHHDSGARGETMEILETDNAGEGLLPDED